jgi:hypothetical protein
LPVRTRELVGDPLAALATQVGDGSLTLEKMVLDDEGRPQPTGELEQNVA